jgi:hypothetical protein
MCKVTDIGDRQHFIEAASEFDIKALEIILRYIGVVAHDFHIEAPRTNPRHVAADGADADDGERAVAKLLEGQIAPRRVVVRGDHMVRDQGSPQHRQHEPDRALSNGQ